MATPAHSGVEGWPLVGRRKELAQLTTALLGQRGAVITGRSGLGKTTLAVAGLRHAEEKGMSVARTTATHASRRLPFGAFASMLPPDPTGAEVLSGEDHPSLLRHYARAVAEGADGRPLVVFVDDAHLLDDGSATLLHQLALTRAATVVATVRSRHPVPDPVVALWKDGLAERITLGILDEAEIEELVGAVLGGPVEAGSVRQLADRSEGNPMVLRELVAGALETGTLVEEVVGIWRLRGALRPTGRLVELIAARLDALTEPERAVVELLTLGEPLGEGSLAQLAEPAAVDALERKGVVRSRMDRRRVQVWLAHPVYGDVVRVRIGALRQRALAGSLADAIEAAGGRRRDDTLLLASLRLIGGRGSADLLLAGAVKARSRQDHPLAEQLARAAIDEGAGFEARVLAAEAAHARGRHDQAESELAALAAQAPSDAERARVAILRFDNAFRLDGRAELGLIDDAVAAITDPSLRDELLTRRLYVLHASRGPRAGLEEASALITHLEAAPPSVAHIVLSFALARRGRIDDALEVLGQPLGSTSTPAIDESWVEWNLFGLRAVVRLYAGALGEAEELLSGGYRLVVDEPAAEARAYVAGGLSVVYLEQGRAMSAARRATEAYTLYRQVGRDYAALRPYSFAVHALALSGQPRRAAETLVARDALGLPTALLYEGDLLQARAWTAAASGDLPAARVQLYAAADLGEEIGDLVGATSALHGLARLGRAQKVAARLAALAKEVDGPFATARAAYANAVAASDSAALDEVAQSFEHLGAILYAAEATAEAAVILRHDGEARKGAAAELKAARLLARCEGATTPPVQLITARVRLTPGELDAAVQAAAGHTNKQIAGDMHLSVRTVESHLQRAYEKLGISGRRALADALQDLPTP